MPGLLRGVACTAVVAGTATAVSNNVSRRQGQRWAGNAAREAPPQAAYAPAPQQAPPPQYAPQPAAPSAPDASMDDQIAQLSKLGDLKSAGILTDAEFQAETPRSSPADPRGATHVTVAPRTTACPTIGRARAIERQPDDRPSRA